MMKKSAVAPSKKKKKSSEPTFPATTKAKHAMPTEVQMEKLMIEANDDVLDQIHAMKHIDKLQDDDQQQSFSPVKKEKQKKSMMSGSTSTLPTPSSARMNENTRRKPQLGTPPPLGVVAIEEKQEEPKVLSKKKASESSWFSKERSKSTSKSSSGIPSSSSTTTMLSRTSDLMNKKESRMSKEPIQSTKPALPTKMAVTKRPKSRELSHSQEEEEAEYPSRAAIASLSRANHPRSERRSSATRSRVSKAKEDAALPALKSKKGSSKRRQYESDSGSDSSAASMASSASNDDEDELADFQQHAFTVNHNQALGSGGFGVVYKGFDNIRGEHVAVKEAKIGHGDASLEQELRGEFELLTTLDHPNIVKVRHFNVENGVAQIFMEWMSSGSVQGILRENGFRMHEAAIRRYAAESLKGLHYLHGREMLHRDVKPANMLVAGSGAVKLSDFGTSKVQESTSTTQHVVGTCAYMAPETIRGKYSPGSDVWAWACSVVEMATGQPPWSHLPREQRGNIQLMFHIGSSQPPDHAPAVPDHLSGALREILTKCFDFDACKRPSCAELLGMGYFTTQRLPGDAESLEAYQQEVGGAGTSAAGSTDYAMTDSSYTGTSTVQTASTMWMGGTTA